MEILYIAPSLPNDFSRVRSKNIIKALKNKECNITLISLYSSKKDLVFLEETKQMVDKVILFKQPKIISLINCFIGILSPYTLRTLYVYNKKLHKYLKKSKADYDMIYVKRLRMAQYGKYFDKSKVYIDITDSLTKYYDRIRKQSKGIKKIISEEEYIKHKIYETSIIKKYNTIICSEEDKKYLIDKWNIDLNNMLVINNSIDTEKWINENVSPKSKNKRTKIVFSGMMDYEPNILAVHYIVEKIMPLLGSNYSVSFVGKNCSEELKNLESNNIHFVGYVDDMKKELQKYDMYICPIIAGSGVKNKILQAASVGLPIVSNSLGIEGVEEDIKKYVFLGNTPEELARQIEQINKLDTHSLKNIIMNQQKFIIEKYDINVAIEKLVKK